MSYGPSLQIGNSHDSILNTKLILYKSSGQHQLEVKEELFVNVGLKYQAVDPGQKEEKSCLKVQRSICPDWKG